MTKSRPKLDRHGQQKHGPGLVAEGYAANLGRARVQALDEQLARLRGAIPRVALACMRGNSDAARLVQALLGDVDDTRAQLREVEAEP